MALQSPLQSPENCPKTGKKPIKTPVFCHFLTSSPQLLPNLLTSKKRLSPSIATEKTPWQSSQNIRASEIPMPQSFYLLYLQIFRDIRKECRAPQVQFRFILDERQYVLLGLFVIDIRKTFVEKPDQTIPIQRTLFPDKSGIDQPRLQMRQIDRRPFCKIKDIIV